MCGIFGMAAKEPKFISSPNIKILGMLNESRGRTCCGVTVDGEIYHGHDKEKLFTDFAKGRSFAAKQVPVVIGHTRQASTGMAVNKHNAHPFGFGELNGGYAFVGVHNGTLLNHKELAVKYEIELTESVPSEYVEGVMVSRTKIDSEILLEIIYKTKTLKVLSEYNGRAALVWQDLTEPDVVYLYSGKSVPEEGDDEIKAVEERPMNVWIAGRNNFYFSSMPDSLEIIGADAKDVFQIEYNTVYIVKGGNFNQARKIRISRKGNFHTETYTWGNYGRPSNYQKHWPSSCTVNAETTKEVGTSGAETKQTTLDLNEGTRIIRSTFHIYDDETCLPEGTYKNKVYSKKLRYYRNGHLITGIYTYVRGSGFIYLGAKVAEAEQSAKFMVDMPFNITTAAFDVDSVWKPFESINDIFFYYFIEGVMVESVLDYKVFLHYSTEKLSFYLTPEKLSQVSKYPVASVAVKGHYSHQNIYKDGTLFTGNFRGIDQYKSYYFLNGNLIMTKTVNGDIVTASADYLDRADVKNKDIYENTFYVKSECWNKSFANKITTPKVIELPVTTATNDNEGYDESLFKTVLQTLEDAEEAFIKQRKGEPSITEIATEEEISEYLCEIVTERIVEIDNVVSELREELRDYKENPLYESIMNDVNQISKITNEYIK